MSDTEKHILRALDTYKSAVLAKNAETFLHLYDPEVRVFDTWVTWSYDGATAWSVAIERWFFSLGAESVRVTFEDVKIAGDRDFASMIGLGQGDSEDNWFYAGASGHEFDLGKLRHLFFQSCGALSSFSPENNGANRLLFSEWFPATYVRGVRTVSGGDTGFVVSDREGWRFFSRYNKGESLADSFALGSMDENPN